MRSKPKSSRKVSGASRVESRPKELLYWYDNHRRHLPWRAPPGETPDPYRVWVSEIMLQQTQVNVVRPYFEEFMYRWPTLDALFHAKLDEVLHCWQGLGYYARAHNLYRCAHILVCQFDSKIPTRENELAQLPGIGPYTAAAIAAIAFNQPALVVDGNVERVIARMYAVNEPLPYIKSRLRSLAAEMMPKRRYGDYAQAVMDLGAMICTPRRPKCSSCPWHNYCGGKETAETYPRRLPRKIRPIRHGVAYWVTNRCGAVLIRRRTETALLKDMMEVPSGDWLTSSDVNFDLKSNRPPVKLECERLLPGVVRHNFTHFKLELRVVAGKAYSEILEEGFWCNLEDLDDHPLSSLTKKIVRHAIKCL